MFERIYQILVRQLEQELEMTKKHCEILDRMNDELDSIAYDLCMMEYDKDVKMKEIKKELRQMLIKKRRKK